MSELFSRCTNADIAALVAEYPFAWIVAGEHRELVTQMPMILEQDAEGRPVSMLGHLPRSHPLVALGDDWCARFLFRGPHGYISPGWVSKEGWAPTWNFASASIEAQVQLSDDLIDEALERLVDHMERDRARPWKVADMGARYTLLREQVIGFRARITALNGRFKLAQDEAPSVYEEILHQLHPGPLASWMERFAQR